MRDITSALSKGKNPLVPDEAMDVLVDLISLLCLKRFDLTVTEVFLQLLKVDPKSQDVSAERMTVALLSAKSVCSLLSISSAAHTASRSPTPSSLLTDISVPDYRKAALLSLRSECNMNQDTLLYACGASLDHLLPILDNQFGHFLSPLHPKTMHDVIPNSKWPLLDLFDVSISCLKFALPLKMDENFLISLLIRLTTHLHEPLRVSSLLILEDFVTNRPFIRSAVVNQYVLYLRGIKEEHLDCLMSVMSSFFSLLNLWFSLGCSEVMEHYHKVRKKLFKN